MIINLAHPASSSWGIDAGLRPKCYMPQAMAVQSHSQIDESTHGLIHAVSLNISTSLHLHQWRSFLPSICLFSRSPLSILNLINFQCSTNDGFLYDCNNHRSRYSDECLSLESWFVALGLGGQVLYVNSIMSTNLKSWKVWIFVNIFKKQSIPLWTSTVVTVVQNQFFIISANY
jgi:hypothetical protein